MLFISKIVFDFAELFLVAILVRNLYTGDPCESVRSLPPQTKGLFTWRWGDPASRVTRLGGQPASSYKLLFF